MLKTNPDLIKSTVLEEVNQNFSLPIYTFCHKVIDLVQSTNLFLYYRTYRLVAYIPKEAVFVGGALHTGAWFFGLNQYLKVALYIKCTLELFNKYEQLYDSCEALTDAFTFRYPVYKAYDWDFTDTHIPPSLILQWQTVKIYLHQLLKVVACAVKVLWEVFKIGLFLRDLYLLTQNDQTIEFYAYTDLVADVMNHCRDLKQNTLLLVDQLRSQEALGALGNRVLQKMGMGFEISTLINDLMNDNPEIFTKLNNSKKNAQEIARELFETGGTADFSGIFQSEKRKIPQIPECRFIPFFG